MVISLKIEAYFVCSVVYLVDVVHIFVFMEITFGENHRSGEACTAYVTFKDAYSQETACLLSVSKFYPN